MRRALAAATALGACLQAAPAQAEDAFVRLAWVRGPGAHACARQQAIAERVTERLGRSPFRDDAARSVEAYLTRDDAGWRVAIFARDGEGALTGSREVTSAAMDCAPIEAASVLALALAIDPVAAMQAPEERPRPRDTTAPPPLAPVSTPPVPASRPPQPLEPVVVSPPAAPPPSSSIPPFGAELRGGAALGLLPKLAPMMSLAVDVEVSRIFRVTGEALWLPEVHASDTRFAFGLEAFALGACGSVLRNDRVDLAACGAIAAGAIHAVVYALVPVDPGEHPWVGAELGPLLHVRLAGPLRLEVGAPFVVPLTRQPFRVIGTSQTVFQESVIGLRPFLGLGVSFR